MHTAALVFPNQLYHEHPASHEAVDNWILIEDSLFFRDPHYPAAMHKQKLWLHRASMRRYAEALRARGRHVTYIAYNPQAPLLGEQLKRVLGETATIGRILTVDPVDYILEKRIRTTCAERGWALQLLPSPGFLNSKKQNATMAPSKKWKMADFYRGQRERLGVLMNGSEPVGGKWSFDEENRKKIPKKLLSTIPGRLHLERDEFDTEAQEYVRTHFGDHPGSIENLYYPSSREHALQFLNCFLEERLAQFGDFEDAIVEGQSWLWHSVLTPSLNIGLLTPDEVVSATLGFAQRKSVPLNSLEGFLRQVIGWREFMRATYEDLGVRMRSSNHWNHRRSMPRAFYDGNTGILPLDDAINRVKETGYCHHIERLMVLGGFFFLCEIDPEDIYTWFMELFVDSYDWVMVPNVYSMSQHADGGLITTKPYFSGSAYIRRMSHYKKGPWCDVWDGLYWSWIDKHEESLRKNPRWAMMCAAARRMDDDKMNAHKESAACFLRDLH